MSGFSGLTIATRALRAAQIALEVTGHNIANANTEGYSRQRVDLVEAPPDITPWGVKGTGVEISNISRVKEDYLDIQLRNETKLLGQWEEKEKFLSRLELYFNEPSDEALNNMFAEFWSRWEDLSLTPEEQTSRSNLLQQADMLASSLNMLYTNMNSLRFDADEAIKSYVQEVNSLAQNIASLNDQIRFYEIGDATANDLRDQRDLLLKKLSELIDFSSEEQPDGTLIISVGGVNLVDRIDAEELSYRYNSEGHVVPVWSANNEDVVLRGGKLKGAVDSRDTIIPTYINRINNIATTLIKEVNRQHANGWGTEGFSSLTSSYTVSDSTAALASADSGLDFYDEIQDGIFVVTVKDSSGNTVSSDSVSITTTTTLDDIVTSIGSDYTSGISHLRASVDADGHLVIEAEDGYNFFINQDTSNTLMALGLNTFFSGTNASNIAVNSTISSNVRHIAASSSGEIGDGSNAIAIASIKEQTLMDNNSATIYDYYASTLGTLGVDKLESENMKRGQEILITHIQNSIEDVSGVSLDEEAMNMLKFQHSYEAAARYMQTVNDMLETLINVVGGIR